MQRTVLLAWLAALFVAMASVLALTAVLVGWPILLVAAPLAAVGYLFYYHASGRLTERLREQAERNPAGGPRGTGGGRRPGDGPGGGPFSAGPRGRRAADGGPRWREPVGGDPWDPRGGAGAGGDGAAATGMAPERARSILDLDATADQEALRSAYRRKVKQTHPDRGGDAEAFKRVTEAYETLGGD